MSDTTGMSSDFVVNQYQVQWQADNELTPAVFFRDTSSVRSDCFALPVVLADIKNRTKNELPIDLGSYFKEFAHLKDHPEAWRILDAAESMMVEQEGLNWRKRWVDQLPDIERPKQLSGLIHAAESAEQSKAIDLDLSQIQPGDRILDFEIQGVVGRGTYGVVYRACNLALGREVALKISTGSGNEGRALARLNHENIVRVYGEHSVGSKRILEMQFVRGGTLDGWISRRQAIGNLGSDGYLKWVAECIVTQTEITSQKKQESLSSESNSRPGKTIPDRIQSPTRVAVWVVAQLAAALQHSHSRGILHQDVKPGNVLVDELGNPLLTDFNVALISGQNSRDTIGGTVNYMSPEQLRAYCTGDAESLHAVDLRSDLYSLGIVLLEILGGDKVWGDVTAKTTELMARQLLAVRLRSTPAGMRNLDGVNHSLAAIIEKSLKPEPSNRYQSAADFGADLTRWLDGATNIHAANPNFLERIVRSARSHRVLVAALLCTTIAICGSLFGWAKWEAAKLEECNELLLSCEQALQNRRGSIAAEQLGTASARLDQVWISKWFNSSELQKTRLKAEQCSKLVKRLELFRFSSLFGQASLLNIHQDSSKDSANNGSDLAEASLRTYGVMSDPAWFEQPPFSGLQKTQKQHVAENITELMLVSMINSSRNSAPSESQWNKVLERLPPEHESFGIFELLKSGMEIPRDHSFEAVADDFESYLFGVWATCKNENEKAHGWYEASLSHRSAGNQEQFWLRYRLGLTCQRLGHSQQALIHYAVCLGRRPEFAWIPFNMALVYVQLEQPTQAINYLENAIELDPLLTAAYVALGAVHFGNGDYQEAFATYDRAIAAAATSPELLRNRELAKSKLLSR